MAKISFSEKFKNLFSSKKNNEEFFEELTDILVEGDIGAKMAFELTEELESLCKAKKIFEVCEKLFSIEENCVIDREVIPEAWWKC